ncbi:interleukin-23 receptor [Alligator sinensis]|uniref:Leptin receptor n=1 Tax=Alligator sinensis TaxID=38654 RepID=A0A3Q0HAR3_ALLSI|nr:interleukin-23 receptor [Alligator sinensis]
MNQIMVRSKVTVTLHILFCWIYRGVINLHCSGYVWIEPAPVVQLGWNISINCHSTINCEKSKLYMSLNDTHIQDKLLRINRTTVQLQLQDFRKPDSTTVVCFAKCPNSIERLLVCGTQFSAGYPPDSPRNLTCVIYEHSSHMTCTWDPGKRTYITTDYTLLVWNVQTCEKKAFPSKGTLTIPLNKLQGEKRYSMRVQAQNVLGTAYSPDLIVDLEDLVIPAAPVITFVETTNTSAPRTIMHWRKQTLVNNVYCEERYKATTNLTWQIREWDMHARSKPCTEYTLEPNTEYEFQVRCRIIRARSNWSAWSVSFIYLTPEAAPANVPVDVWRLVGPVYANGSREVTVLIKPLVPKDARGRILGYTVYYKHQGERFNLCNTSETKCKVLVSAEVHTLHVTAYNSKGSSKPANITADYQAFPSPTNMQIKYENQSGITVKWEPPRPRERSVLWFIVEWTSAFQQNQVQNFHWKKVQDTTTYIQDIAAGRHYNVSVYAVYQDGISQPCSVQSYLEDLVNQLQKGNMYADPVIISTATGEIPYDDEVGVFLGLGIGTIILSIAFLTLMSKKSFRKRISTVAVSLTPTCLLEDFPHMENSNMIKSLQEKSEFMNDISTEFYLVDDDPVVTEIQENSLHGENKTVDTPKDNREVTIENADSPQNSSPDRFTATEHSYGYKPQIFNGNTLGYICSNAYETQTQTLDPHASPSSLDTNVFLKDYTSPTPYLWNAEGVERNIFLLEKINLILSNSRSGQSSTFSSANEEPSRLVENQQKGSLSIENVQEQTLVPDEMVSCLSALNEGSRHIKSYFPQTTGRIFQ